MKCSGSMMCPLHEHQAELALQDVSKTMDRLNAALVECNVYRKAALKYQHLFRLTAFTLAVVVALVIAGGWKK